MAGWRNRAAARHREHLGQRGRLRTVLRLLAPVGTAVCLAAAIPYGELAAQTGCSATGTLDGGLYLDVAYLYSPNEPGNNEWRSKTTSNRLGSVSVNNISAFLQKPACPNSRWGIQLGVQGGQDIEGLVPPDSLDAAETLRHLYYTNVSYLAPVGNGLLLTGGLIPGNLGYESFWAMDNPTYTRVYSVDAVPYFHFGLNVTYPFSGRISTSLLVVNGWEHLSESNGLPSYGFQLDWDTTDDLWLRLNLYYGPEQDETSIDLWRFVSEANGEWRIGDFLLAGVAGIGTEKQAEVTGNPRYQWAWGAAWVQWLALDWLRLTVRPEVFSDPDGLSSGARQTIIAITGAVELVAPLDLNDVSLRLEYRFDRSTGPGGGFYEGPDNVLVPNQHLLIGAVNWRFHALGN